LYILPLFILDIHVYYSMCARKNIKFAQLTIPAPGINNRKYYHRFTDSVIFYINYALQNPIYPVYEHPVFLWKSNYSSEVVKVYKYLGLFLTEHLDFNYTAKFVAQAATRSLGLLIAKFKAFGDMHYDCFTKLYDTLVDSAISYGSSVWGYKSYSSLLCHKCGTKSCKSLLSWCWEIYPYIY
jgi:hypothetical protein